MPKLGMSMEEGRVVAWEVEPGGRVEKGELLLIIESEKAEIEIESTHSGHLRHVYIEAGGEDPLPCGTLLAAIEETPDEAFDAEAFRAEHDQPQIPKLSARELAEARPAATVQVPGKKRRAITPAAGGLAKKLGIDVTTVPGSGPGGRVLREDVEAFAARRKDLVSVAEGVALEVGTDGEGDPVVLLPGFGSDISVFARQIPMLVDRYHVSAMNPRGVGLSDAPETASYEVATLASDAAALIEAPAHVIGASHGAAVALELALSHPEKVRSLVLVTPFLEATPRLLAVIDAWIRAADTDTDVLAAMLLPWMFSDAFLADEAQRRLVRRGLADVAARIPTATLERTATGLRAWSGTRSSVVEELRTPTLVVAGGADLLAPSAAEVARRIPAAKCEVIAGSGHAVSIEGSDALNTALANHLAALA
jgi:pimeloyl-ACP methyl ester carboxylesterase